MDFKQEAINIGRRLKGEGLRVDFRNEITKRATERNIPTPEAERDIVVERLVRIQTEINRRKVIDPEDEGIEKLEAALIEVFTAGDLDYYREIVPTTFLPITVPSPAKDELEAQTKLLKKKFGDDPDALVVQDLAEATKSMEAVIVRLLSDPSVTAWLDIYDAVDDEPALQADVGKIMELIDYLESQHRHLERDASFGKSREKLKEVAKKELVAIFFKNPWGLMKKTLIGTMVAGPFGFIAAMMDFAVRETVATTRLSKQILVTAAKLINAKRK